ncbi:MAG TPA: NUDIX domain-containing protein, partial [Acidimicrobiales bacterium]|nr:NUDIX domain-containing protein [Acidimicrobiales bacterium]
MTDAVSRQVKEADRLLIEHPAEHMAESAVKDLQWICRRSRASCIVVALDDYQLAPPELDRWLRRLAGGDYGTFDRRLVFVIAGRVPLGSDWIVHRSAESSRKILNIPLGPLSVHDVATFLRPVLRPWNLEEEAGRSARYLDDCGRIPLLLRLLAHDPRKLVADLRNGHHRSPSRRFEWGLALEEFIERFLDDGRLDASDRSAIVALSIPRVLNDETFRLTLDTAGIPGKDAYRDWLTRADFVDPTAPPYTLHEPVREVFLDSLAQRNPDQLQSVHLTLAAYYRDRVRDAPVDRWWHLSQIEAAYHQLSGTKVHDPSAILQHLLQGLPETYGLLPNWSLMLDQVLHEQTHIGDRAKDTLQRLVSLCRRTWDLANLTSAEIGGGGSIDPAVDIFGADLLTGEVLRVSRMSHEHWLRCFEMRLEMVRGDRPLNEIRDALEALYLECERQSPADSILLMYVATDLAEALTRMGKIPDALRWSRKALDLVSAGSSDFRRAVALVNLGSNLKRADDFSGALDQFRLASDLLVGWRPLPRYRLGLLMLDKANCCSYLGDTGEAASALAAARQYLEGVSPQALAEASHRLGWKRRLEGDLEGSLADHAAAIDQFDEVVARAGHERSVPSAVLRILRAKAQHSMANTLTEMHLAQDALSLYRQARTVFLDLGQHRHAAIVQKDMAMAQSGVEGTDEAVATLELVLGAFRHRSDHYLGGTHTLEGLLSLARICLLSGRLDRAREVIVEAASLEESLADATSQLGVRVRLEGCLVTVLSGDPAPEAELDEVERQIAGWPAPRTDLQAYVVLVRAIAQANAGLGDPARRQFQRAREQAGRWNRFLPHDLDLVWAARRNADAPRREVELFDTYDELGHFLEAISSEIVHQEGRWHRSFHCWITGQDHAGRKTVLFQRRGPFSRDFPNLLDISSAGHYRAGEGIDGGLRELREELNLEIRPEDLQLLATRRISEILYNGRRNNEVQDIYLLARPTHPLVDYRPAYPEVAAVV